MKFPAHLPIAEGSWRFVQLTGRDCERLQNLLVRCSDFNQLINGEPPGEHEAEETLMDLPPGKTSADKIVLGIEDQTGALVGLIDLVKDFPEQDKWFIGLLLLAPAERGKGSGKLVMKALEDWACEGGARKLGLGVLEHNLEGHAFWLRMGFTELLRRPPRKFGQREGVVIAMEKQLIANDERITESRD